jgi:3-dehydrotetronate 4-kinase
MRHHPLTPMTDACLPRVLQAQCRQAVGLVEHATVRQGEAAVAAKLEALQSKGVRLAIVDAITNDDLMGMRRAFAGLPLLVAGSGVAIGLPQNHGIVPGPDAARLPALRGSQAIVSGSCSAASNAQVVNFMESGGSAFAVDPLRIAAGVDVVAEALVWAASLLGDKPVLFYATAEPDAVKVVQSRLGVSHAGELVEGALSKIALGLVERGVRKLIVAGGETSGSCVQALAIRQMRIGHQIDPGVPWCHVHAPAAGNEGLLIALKSGNFGSVDFFNKAFETLT